MAASSSTNAVIATLLGSPEPSIRWKTRVGILGEDPSGAALRKLQQEIRTSPRVKKLLEKQDRRGQTSGTKGVYAKWQGTHWVLATLADLGYPAGDESLAPMRDRVLETWLDESFYREFEASSKAEAYGKTGVPLMQGRYRRCASQQAYPIYFLLELGLADSRIERLVERLYHWRWPDGGWNCDKDPSASHSSFIHTIHCVRALHAYGVAKKNSKAKTVARSAAELFLTRQLFKRKPTGKVIREEFTKLHYPLYWHYDILLALKIMSEAGLIRDPRCSDALDLLESKVLKNGGFPAESRYYKTGDAIQLGADFVDWGGTSKTKSNPWVTVDALTVLTAAGRFRP